MFWNIVYRLDGPTLLIAVDLILCHHHGRCRPRSLQMFDNTKQSLLRYDSLVETMQEVEGTNR